MRTRSSIMQGIEQSRQELLDLGNRNPLINFKPSMRRSVEIIDERAAEVFRILHAEQRSMRFAALPDMETQGDAEAEPEDPLTAYLARHAQDPEPEAHDAGVPAERHTDNQLQTNCTDPVLTRRLINVHRLARTSITERGVNTLFLSLGMLKWQEPRAGDYPKQAPVLLLPVALDRTSVGAKFTIRHNGDEVGTNLSLQARLAESGVSWPALPEDMDAEDGAFDAYFTRCEEAIRESQGWELSRDAMHLGFFSFHKYVMYKDLDVSNWGQEAPGQDSALMRLLGDGGFGGQPKCIPDSGSLDEVLDHRKLFQVVDADSSQTIVLAEADSGKDMVVQGPPGTGKSQIIVNLIAQAVAQGKTVLFVAEKLPALEVVKGRLDELGLGDIALELHGASAQKKVFLKRLQAVWKSAIPAAAGFEKNHERRAECVETLNRHSQLINEELGKSGVTPFHIFGRLLFLDEQLGAAAPQLELAGWEDWSDKQYRAVQARAEELQDIIKDVGALAVHPFRDTTLVGGILPGEGQELATQAGDAEKLLTTGLLKRFMALQRHFDVPEDLSLRELEGLLGLLKDAVYWPELSGLPQDTGYWAQPNAQPAAVIDDLLAVEQHRRKNETILYYSAWDSDNVVTLLDCLQKFRGRRKLWCWMFSSEYRIALDKTQPLWRVKLPTAPASLLQPLEAIVATQKCRARLKKANQAMRAVFGKYWQQEKSDARQLRRICHAMRQLHDCGLRQELRESLLQALLKDARSPPPAPEVEALDAALVQYQNALDALLQRLQITTQRNAPEREFKDYPLKEQSRLLGAWHKLPEKLPPVARFNHTLKALNEPGLQALGDLAARWDGAQDGLVMLLERAWYTTLLKKHLRDHPQLNQFSATAANRYVEEFMAADKKAFEHNIARVLTVHRAALPPRHAAGEMMILNKEFSKKSRHRPIRMLMREAGRAIQKAKPVFMMSPYSVASYVPCGQLEFDVVIFDEASQVRPVDAYGALLRAKQAIVVGDKEQMPPSTFFERMQSDDEDGSEEEGDTAGIESILTLFEARGAFPARLRWHYRSRHNSLIEYSNHGFYGDDLVIFPAPEARSPAAGLGFVKLDKADSVYEKGGKNLKEAEHVAQQVMEHARQSAGQTLGVATFSVNQAQAIEDQLELKRRQDKSLETFFAEHGAEPFFVKSLENVQGDERDVIFISIGYGHDDAGRVAVRFGPLNQVGGERRLNVLITRARRRCVVFSNMTAADIDTSKSQAAGVRHLKHYLRFAQTGRLVEAPHISGREPDSPFEIDVRNAIRKLGYQVDCQVGSSGYHIDLVVKDPTQPGRYVLAVECDGASYHSARWARDRDRLRQSVLEGLGWTFHRVWSQSWFNERNTELEKLKQAIEAARQRPKTPPSPVPPIPIGPRPRPAPELPTAPPPSLPRYQVADVETIKVDQFEEVPDDWLEKQALRVVEIEGPVHKEVVIRRIREAAAIKKAGRAIRRRFDAVFASLSRRRKIRVAGDFITLGDAVAIAVRNRNDVAGVSSEIGEIAPEEIREVCMKHIMPDAFSIEREALYRSLLASLGLGALSASRKKYLADIVAELLRRGALKETGGRIMLAEEGGAG